MSKSMWCEWFEKDGAKDKADIELSKRDRWKAVLLSKNNTGIITLVFWTIHLSCLNGKKRRWVGDDVG